MAKFFVTALVVCLASGQQACIPLDERCSLETYNGECCQDNNIVTCMDPWLSIGYDRCKICASNGASCADRTECCSNCCSDGACADNYESCNLVETFWVVFFWFLVFSLILGVGGYFLIKWICDKLTQKARFYISPHQRKAKDEDSPSAVLVLLNN